MKLPPRLLSIVPALLLLSGIAHAAHTTSDYNETINLFKKAGKSAAFFHRCYGYAVFPTIGEGAIGVGGAYGTGHVYVHGKWVGNATMKQVSVGFQMGGKAYSEIIFFEDKRSLDEFESGSFEFAAGLSAVAVTAGASASAGTTGASAEAGLTKDDAKANGIYQKGMAVFTIAKGGLMYAAAIAGQKFSFAPRGREDD